MLTNIPINGQGQDNLGAWPFNTAWPGLSSFNITYGNGTQSQIPVVAVSQVQGLNFTNGEDLFEAVCLPQPVSADLADATPPAIATPLDPPANYPPPILRDQYNLVVGYYPTDFGLADVAVLSVPTFSTTGSFGDGVLPNTSLPDFAIQANDFVTKAAADGKRKIIIDVSNNPGGDVDSGFALLSIFFPNQTIYSATRWRSHNGINLLGKIHNTGDNSNNPDVAGSPFFVPAQVRPDQKTGFESIQDLFRPFDVDGVPSSALVAEFSFINEANPTLDPINIYGQGGQLNDTAPPFAPENILIVSSPPKT